jgi:hypothetical protein
MRIEAHGLAVEAPQGLDARIFRRAPETAREVTRPVVHLCTRAMPEDRGDYGSGVVELLGAQDVFVSLTEFGPEAVGTPLFAHQGLPADFDPRSFSHQALQRTLAGQSGAQFWFTEGGRAFCLYVVLGSHANRGRLVPTVRRLVSTLRIEEQR